MTTEPQSYKYIILSSLLSKYEASTAFQAGNLGRRRPQWSIGDSPLARDYNDEMDYAKREAINAALLELEAEGVVALAWPKHRERTEVTRVYLELGALDRAYELAGLTPKASKLSSMRTILDPLLAHPWGWVADWAQSTDAALSARKAAGLDLDAPDLYCSLARVLLALPSLTESTPRRVFSQRVLGDSKEFEQRVEKVLLQVLRAHGPAEYETDEEYLDSVNLVVHPKLTLLAGELEFTLNGIATSLVNFPGGLGLAHQSIKALSITALSTKPMLTVENLTTYYQVTQHQQSRWGLVVYTGGFPHSGTKQLLAKLAVALISKTPAAEVYHWGDIDYGGIRIFQHLKETFFPSLRPYLMDVAAYREYADRGLSFEQSYALRLQALLHDERYLEWHPLLLEMLSRKVRVEQESIGLQ